MPFPISRSLIIAVEEHWHQEYLLSDIATSLNALGAVDVKRDDSTLLFSVPWGKTSGPLFLVSSGTFSIGPDVATGRRHCLKGVLSFRRAAITVAVLCYGWLGIGASLIQGQYSGGSFLGTLVVCTFSYCWLLGVWYL